jgi:hypothetical protein
MQKQTKFNQMMEEKNGKTHVNVNLDINQLSYHLFTDGHVFKGSIRIDVHAKLPRWKIVSQHNRHSRLLIGSELVDVIITIILLSFRRDGNIIIYFLLRMLIA